MPLTQAAAGLKHGWRSGLEEKVAAELTAKGIGFEYEMVTGGYTIPARQAKYTPDIVLDNGIVIETKGRWVTEDRKKIKLVRSQHPDLDLRMVFGGTRKSPSMTPISKSSRTTYADYCRYLGIPFADKTIPDEWLHEPRSVARWRAIEEFRAAARRKAE